MKRVLLVAAAISVLLGLCPGSALAGDDCARVASPSGSDAAEGSELAPLRTPQRLIESLAPGQTGCLRGGSYTASNYVLAPRRGGAEGAPITVRSYPGERARLIGIVQIPQGSDYITLSGLDIEGTGSGGANTIKVYSRGVVIEDSDITNAWRGRSCLILGNNADGGQAVAPTVRRNTFHECGNPANGNLDHAIYAANVDGGEIVDNLFYNSAAYTIQLYPSAHNTHVAHNVIDGSAPSVRGGIVFGGDSGHASTGNLVERNVIAGAATSAITSNWEGPIGTGNVASNNCVWGSRYEDIASAGGFTPKANIVGDPGFVSRAARDYRLTRSSRCLGTIGYDTLSRIRGALPGATKGARPTRPLGVTLRRPAGVGLLQVRVSGASRGSVRISLQRRLQDRRGWSRPRVRVMRLRADGTFSVRHRLTAGRYRARAEVRDRARARTARSNWVRFRVR